MELFRNCALLWSMCWNRRKSHSHRLNHSNGIINWHTCYKCTNVCTVQIHELIEMNRGFSNKKKCSTSIALPFAFAFAVAVAVAVAFTIRRHFHRPFKCTIVKLAKIRSFRNEISNSCGWMDFSPFRDTDKLMLFCGCWDCWSFWSNRMRWRDLKK